MKPQWKKLAVFSDLPKLPAGRTPRIKKHSYDGHMLGDYDNNFVLGEINFAPMLEITLAKPAVLWITQLGEVSNHKYKWMFQDALTNPNC